MSERNQRTQDRLTKYTVLALTAASFSLGVTVGRQAERRSWRDF